MDLVKILRLTIPNNVGVISAFNTLVLDNIQGIPKVDSSSSVVYVGGGGTSVVNGGSINFLNNVTDGLHFRVRHSNHGMYSPLDLVYYLELSLMLNQRRLHLQLILQVQKI